MSKNRLLFEKLTRWATNKPVLKEDKDPCWDDYEMVGMKNKNGKEVPNCVPKESVDEGHGGCGCEACKDNEDEMIFGQELEEAPNKGKAVEKTVDGKKRSYGQAGKTPTPGTERAHSYCARSNKIPDCKNPPCPNTLSRKRWKCQGDRSVP